MGRSFYIIAGLSGFLAGVLGYRVFWPGWGAVLGMIGLSCFFLFLKRFAQNTKIGILTDTFWKLPKKGWLNSSLLLFCALFIMAAAFGLGRAKLAEHRVTPDQIDFYNGQEVEFTGIILEPDIRRDQAKYTIRIEQPVSFRPERSEAEKSLMMSDQERDFSTALEMTQVTGNVLISLAKYPQYQYGDRVRVKGLLEVPGEFEGFSYENYLSRFGIYSVMRRPKVELLGKGEGNWFWRGMFFLQNQFMERLNRLFPEPQASFEAGLLVGARKGIAPELMDKFNITGLTHIIAISGYNITIVIAAVMWALQFLARRKRFWVAIIGVVLFTLFVGASPSVVRAAIMGILGLIALNTGRQNSIHLTVLWTAFFMVMWNPKILWWDVGFQLSFLAVLGLIYVAPLFKKYTEKLPAAFGAREAIVMTLSAQVMALPIILYNFERLSLIAPISNLLVAFAIPPAMLLGFAAVLLSFLFTPLALGVAYLGWGVLSYILKVVEFSAAIPYASVNWPGMTAWMMAGYYVLLGIGLYYWRPKRSA